MVRLGIRSIWASNLSQPKHPTYIWIGWGPLTMRKEGWSGLRWRCRSTQKVIEVLVAQSPTLCDPMDCRPPGTSVHGISHKNTKVCCHFLPQGIFPPQWWNPGLLHHRQILYHLRYQGSPRWVHPGVPEGWHFKTIHNKGSLPKRKTHLRRTAVLGALSYIIHTFFPNLLH